MVGNRKLTGDSAASSASCEILVSELCESHRVSWTCRLFSLSTFAQYHSIGVISVLTVWKRLQCSRLAWAFFLGSFELWIQFFLSDIDLFRFLFIFVPNLVNFVLKEIPFFNSHFRTYWHTVAQHTLSFLFSVRWCLCFRCDPMPAIRTFSS